MFDDVIGEEFERGFGDDLARVLNKKVGGERVAGDLIYERSGPERYVGPNSSIMKYKNNESTLVGY